MIYTCTLNPSLDYILTLDKLEEGRLNRTLNEAFYPGGKGVNVSVLLNNLEIKSKALGFTGGFTGNKFLEQLSNYPYVIPNFIDIEEDTRINVKIRGVKETEINARGPKLHDKYINDFMNHLMNIEETDVFILSGSSLNIKENLYQKIGEIISLKKALFIVDSTGESLLCTLKYKPFLIKPNRSELEDLINMKLSSRREIIYCGKQLQKMGAKNVLISLGEKGAILVTESQVFEATVPQGEVTNTVGSGDSMVAGFIASYIHNKSYEEALRFSVACGSATAYSEFIGNKKLIETLYEDIEVHLVEED